MFYFFFISPSLFLHNDFAVGDFFFSLPLSPSLLLLLKQSELVWSDLKWLSNPSAVLCPEKACMRSVNPPTKICSVSQQKEQTLKHGGCERKIPLLNSGNNLCLNSTSGMRRKKKFSLSLQMCAKYPCESHFPVCECVGKCGC